MFLPDPSHNTAAGREKLRREAELETRAALGKLRRLEDDKKKQKQQVLQINLRRLKGTLAAKESRLRSLKRDENNLDTKKQLEQNKDRVLKQKQSESEQALELIAQEIRSLETKHKAVLDKLAQAEKSYTLTEKENNEKRTQLMTIEKSLNQVKDKRDSFKEELDRADRIRKENQRSVDNLKKEIEVLTNQMREKEKAITNQINLATDLRRKISLEEQNQINLIAEKARNDRNQRNDGGSIELDKLKAETVATKTKIETLRQKQTEIEKSIHDAKTTGSRNDREVIANGSRLGRVNREYESLERDIKKINQEIDKINTELKNTDFVF